MESIVKAAQVGRIDFGAIVDVIGILRAKLWDRGRLYPRVLVRYSPTADSGALVDFNDDGVLIGSGPLEDLAFIGTVFGMEPNPIPAGETHPKRRG
jgi:hypothetical protein